MKCVTPLNRDFFARDTIDVAIDLIGKTLVHSLPGGQELRTCIVETEAYLGTEDPACHSFGGRRTARTEVMYGEPGFSYVYFIYGMYFCFNVITMAKDVPEAVLIRAAQLLPSDHSRANLANGPGKLCQVLSISRQQNGIDISSSLSCLRVETIAPELANKKFEVIEGPRIGLGDKHDAVHWPLRFGWKDHPALSPYKF